MDFTIFLLALLALVLGLAAGWFAGARAAGQWRDKFNEAVVNLAAERKTAERVEAAESELRGERERNASLAARVAAFERGEEERLRAHEAQINELKLLESKIEAKFGELAGKAVEGAHKLFLERADERFGHAGRAHEEKLKALLQPVSDRLKSYEEQVAKVEKDRTEAYGNLVGLIDTMRSGQEAVRNEAARLVNSLRAAPKARGRWGEQQLRNVLETCGLSEYCDFSTEVSVDTEDGKLRPDVVIRVPGGRSLVVDAKVSLNAYQDAFNAGDEDGRTAGLAAHAAAMRAHVTSLGGKDYAAQFPESPDYVIMFVPGEHFLSAALEHDSGLWDFAFAKRVLLATPTNLIAIAKTVSAVWRQERLADDARRIGELGKTLHDRLAVAAEHLKKVGGGLSTAVNNYNAFVGSFERNVLSTGREFKRLSIETGRREEIEIVPPVEALPRYNDNRPPIEGTEAAE